VLRSTDLIFLSIFCYMVPFIDAMNGYVILAGEGHGSAGTVGQIFKAFILLVGWFFLYGKERIFVAYLAIYILLIELIGLLIHLSFSYFLIGFAFAFKIIFAAVIYFFTVNMLDKYGVIKTLRVFRNSAILYSCIFFISIVLGLSYDTYHGNSFGSKGVFASGNALSIYFGSMSLIGLYVFTLSGKKLDFFLSGLLFTSTLFVGTKVSILFMVVYMVVLIYQISFFYKLLLLCAITMFVVLFSHDFFNLFFNVIVLRFENSDSIISFLASSRDVFVVNALSIFNIEGFYIMRLIFGLGVYMSFRSGSDDLSLYDTLESDLFDILFSYGFIGIFVFAAFYFYHAFKAVSSKNNMLLLVFSMMFLISVLIGHVLFDAMSVIPFVLSAALIIVKSRREAV
jgi:hypothetical protein